MEKKKVKRMIAYADVGSHGGIFAFETGPVADRYPGGLLHIFTEQVTPDLVPVEIRFYNAPTPRKKTFHERNQEKIDRIFDSKKKGTKKHV